MKDHLKPHKDLEAERQLKSIIEKIQSLMYDPKNNSAIEEKLKEAAHFIKAPNRVLDLTVIEHYNGWTDLDGLVGELAMEIPVLPTVSKEDFLSIVQQIREVIKSGQAPDNLRLDYWMDFYRAFFEVNFSNINNVEGLFDKKFENTSLDELVNIAFPHM